MAYFFCLVVEQTILAVKYRCLWRTVASCTIIFRRRDNLHEVRERLNFLLIFVVLGHPVRRLAARALKLTYWPIEMHGKGALPLAKMYPSRNARAFHAYFWFSCMKRTIGSLAMMGVACACARCAAGRVVAGCAARARMDDLWSCGIRPEPNRKLPCDFQKRWTGLSHTVCKWIRSNQWLSRLMNCNSAWIALTSPLKTLNSLTCSEVSLQSCVL